MLVGEILPTDPHRAMHAGAVVGVMALHLVTAFRHTVRHSRSREILPVHLRMRVSTVHPRAVIRTGAEHTRTRHTTTVFLIRINTITRYIAQAQRIVIVRHRTCTNAIWIVLSRSSKRLRVERRHRSPFSITGHPPVIMDSHSRAALDAVVVAQISAGGRHIAVVAVARRISAHAVTDAVAAPHVAVIADAAMTIPLPFYAIGAAAPVGANQIRRLHRL